MSAENFHDPWVFNPKRWMDPENNDILDASQPFSLGSRICLGQRYASSGSHVRGSLTDTYPIKQPWLDGNANNACKDPLQV